MKEHKRANNLKKVQKRNKKKSKKIVFFLTTVESQEKHKLIQMVSNPRPPSFFSFENPKSEMRYGFFLLLIAKGYKSTFEQRNLRLLKKSDTLYPLPLLLKSLISWTSVIMGQSRCS